MTQDPSQRLSRRPRLGPPTTHAMPTLRAAVEAALLGKDERLVAKCDVPGILAVLERWDIYDVDTLSANLESSFAQLQSDLAPVAALSFLGLLKATVTTTPRPPPSDTPSPSSAPPTMPFTQAPPRFSPPIHPPPSATVPLVVTIKMNGKVLAERTTLPVPPSATWEAVARMRLEAVQGDRAGGVYLQQFVRLYGCMWYHSSVVSAGHTLVVSHSVPHWCCHVIWAVGGLLWSSGLEMDSFAYVWGCVCFFGRIRLRRKEGVTRIY